MAFYNHVPHFLCVGNLGGCEAHYQCKGRWDSLHWERSLTVDVLLTKNCTSAVPHNITLFVEFDITIVPESMCGLFIDQRSKVLSVVIIPCVCFGTPQSV